MGKSGYFCGKTNRLPRKGCALPPRKNRIPEAGAPESKNELEIRIHQIGSRMAEVLHGRYQSILVVGGAARGENTFDPDGALLSDVDFYIILPRRHVLAAWLAARDCRKRLRTTLPWIGETDWITTGYGHGAPRFWKMATPFMLELKTNARILSGSEEVRNWPVISRSGQIPRWEGLRLIGNRLCELIGRLGTLPGESFPAASRKESRILAYHCLKLVLACSEAWLIDTHRYGTSYRERMQEQGDGLSEWNAVEGEFIMTAYRAKLNSNPAFFQEPIAGLVEKSLRLAFSALKRFGLGAPGDWIPRVRAENPGAPGWATDIGFFAWQTLLGRSVPFRRAIADVYQDAHRMGLDLLRNLEQDPTAVFPGAAYRRLGVRFKETPQFVGMVRAKGGNG